MLTVGSLFSGIGAFDLGLERAGMEIRWQVEIDPFCREVLTKHWPEVPKHEDVRQIGAGTVEPVDLICGGFPCQDISLAGAGAGLAGERSGLWSEYIRIVRELRPRYVFVENVSALLGRGMGVVLGDLAASGYDAEWDCIPAAAVGAPHRRDRVWIVATAADATSERLDRRVDGAQKIGRDIWQSVALADGSRSTADAGRLRRDTGRTEQPLSRSRADGNEGPYARVAPDADDPQREGHGRAVGVFAEVPRIARNYAPAWGAAAPEPGVRRVDDGTPDRMDRRLHRRADRLKALGNALVPQIVEMIGRRIVDAPS